nr:hypothetical protein JVH1_6713 [Rhodococcus sp. JVH1]
MVLLGVFQLFRVATVDGATVNGYDVVISTHYYYPRPALMLQRSGRGGDAPTC